MNTTASIRRYRIRRLKRQVDRSERRLADLKAEARVEQYFAASMRAHIADLETDAQDRGWEPA